MTSRPGYITPEGAKRIQQEIDFLWQKERPKVTREVSEAAAQGDRSENAEYIYGKKRLREIDRRLRFLMKRLDDLEVVSPTGSPDGKILFGAWAVLEDEDGARVEYRIVGPDEFDVEAGLISMDSPVGRALLGKREGDDVLVRRPRGDIHYTVVEIRYPEAPGDEP